MLSSYTDAVKLTYSSTPEGTSPFQGIQTPQTSSSAWQILQCHDPDSEIVPWMTKPGKREVSINEKWLRSMVSKTNKKETTAGNSRIKT